MFITNNQASFHLWSNMKRSENIMTMVVSKSAKVIAKFALRKDVEIVLKCKKKLKYVNCLEFYSNTDENRNPGLSSTETENNSENVDVSEKNRARKVYIYQSLCPYYRFLYGLGVTNGAIWIKEYEYSKSLDVTHILDL